VFLDKAIAVSYCCIQEQEGFYRVGQIK